jgi:phage tail-like protein
MRRAEIERLLPGVFQAALHPTTGLAQPDAVLGACLDVMEALQQPSEEILNGLARHFDPRRTPSRFVPYLAGWVDLDWLITPRNEEPPAGQFLLNDGLGNLRELVAEATTLARWRGTMRGLLHFLQAATGAADFRIEENLPDLEGRPRSFHISIRAPGELAPQRPLIERIIAAQKPAHATYELAFAE